MWLHLKPNTPASIALQVISNLLDQACENRTRIPGHCFLDDSSETKDYRILIVDGSDGEFTITLVEADDEDAQDVEDEAMNYEPGDYDSMFDVHLTTYDIHERLTVQDRDEPDRTLAYFGNPRVDEDDEPDDWDYSHELEPLTMAEVTSDQVTQRHLTARAIAYRQQHGLPLPPHLLPPSPQPPTP